MDDIIRKVIEAYGNLDPHDMRDAEFYMSASTLKHLEDYALCISDREFANLPAFIFGIPTRIDDNMLFGVVELKAETELDRVVRRAARDGYALNVVKYAPAPKPTLRALIRYWMRRR